MLATTLTRRSVTGLVVRASTLRMQSMRCMSSAASAVHVLSGSSTSSMTSAASSPAPAFGTPPVQAWIRSLPTNTAVGLAHLPPSIFAAPIRLDLIQRAVVHHLNAQRGVVWYHEKSRYEVRGSRRKIRPQKGMGMARVGDRRSPVFRGGGRAFPRKQRDFRTHLQLKVRNFALRSALSAKYAQGQLNIVTDVAQTLGEERDGTDARRTLKSLFDRCGYTRGGAKTLLVYDGEGGEGKDVVHLVEAISGTQVDDAATSSAIVAKSSAIVATKPLPGTPRWLGIQPVDALNVYDLLRFDQLFLTKSAVAVLADRLRVD